MYYEGENVIMDEGSHISCEVKIIKIICKRRCIIEDADGDKWEVDADRLSNLTPDT